MIGAVAVLLRPPMAVREAQASLAFANLSAPLRGFVGAAAICDVVRRALKRAGLDPEFKGAHPRTTSVSACIVSSSGV
jgi:hypothetical protein